MPRKQWATFLRVVHSLLLFRLPYIFCARFQFGIFLSQFMALFYLFLFFFFELACIDNIIKIVALNNRNGTKNELSKLLYIYRPEKNATKLLITVANNTSRTNEIQWHWISLYGPDEHENKTNERRTRYKFVT